MINTIDCVHCGNELPDDVNNCPHCHRDPRKKMRGRTPNTVKAAREISSKIKLAEKSDIEMLGKKIDDSGERSSDKIVDAIKSNKPVGKEELSQIVEAVKEIKLSDNYVPEVDTSMEEDLSNVRADLKNNRSMLSKLFGSIGISSEDRKKEQDFARRLYKTTTKQFQITVDLIKNNMEEIRKSADSGNANSAELLSYLEDGGNLEFLEKIHQDLLDNKKISPKEFQSLHRDLEGITAMIEDSGLVLKHKLSDLVKETIEVVNNGEYGVEHTRKLLESLKKIGQEQEKQGVLNDSQLAVLNKLKAINIQSLNFDSSEKDLLNNVLKEFESQTGNLEFRKKYPEYEKILDVFVSSHEKVSKMLNKKMKDGSLKSVMEKTGLQTHVKSTMAGGIDFLLSQVGLGGWNIGEWVTDLEKVKATMQAVAQGFIKTKDFIKSLPKNIMNMISSTKKFLTKSLPNAFKSTYSKITETANKIYRKSVVPFILAKTIEHYDLLNKLENSRAGKFYKSFKEGVLGVFKKINFGKMFEYAKDTFSNIMDILPDFGGKGKRGKGGFGKKGGILKKATGFISGMGRGIVKGASTVGRGVLGVGKTAIGGLAAAGGGLLKGAGGALKMGGKLLGGAARIAGKFALPLTLAMAGFDAFSGWKNANKIANLKPGQKEANFGQKTGSALASVASGLTFGLVDTKTIYDFFANLINPIFGEDGAISKIFGSIGKMASGKFIDGFVELMGNIFGSDGLVFHLSNFLTGGLIGKIKDWLSPSTSSNTGKAANVSVQSKQASVDNGSFKAVNRDYKASSNSASNTSDKPATRPSMAVSSSKPAPKVLAVDDLHLAAINTITMMN